MVKNESHFFLATDAPSEETPYKDVTDKILSYDPETQNVTKLQIYQPGWSFGNTPYSHNYWEEIYVVSGKVFDGTINRWVGAGEYACRPPGQKHGPFKCADDEGCTVLLINTPSWAKKEA